MIKKYKEIILYLIFGIMTTLVNIVIYYVCTRMLHMNPYFSNIIAWFLSVLFAFITNKTLVFKSKTRTLKKVLIEMMSFFFFRILSLGFDMGSMYVMLSLLKMNDMIAKVIANGIVIVLNYGFSKLFIFKKDKVEEV